LFALTAYIQSHPQAVDMAKVRQICGGFDGNFNLTIQGPVVHIMAVSDNEAPLNHRLLLKDAHEVSTLYPFRVLEDPAKQFASFDAHFKNSPHYLATAPGVKNPYPARWNWLKDNWARFRELLFLNAGDLSTFPLMERVGIVCGHGHVHVRLPRCPMAIRASGD